MKKIIIMAIAVIMAFVNTVQAEIVVTKQSYEEVQRYAEKSIPDVTTDEVDACYNAVKNGGSYQILRKRIKIECSEEEMIVRRRLFF